MAGRFSFLRIAFVAAALSAAASSSLLAGDKIRFTQPRSDSDLSAPPKEEKPSATPSLSSSFGGGNAPAPTTFAAPPMIAPVRHRDNRNKDKWASTDSRNDQTDNNSSTDSRWDTKDSRWGDDPNTSSRDRNTASANSRDNTRNGHSNLEWSPSGQNARSGTGYSDAKGNDHRAWSLRDARGSDLNELVNGAHTPLADALRDETANRMSEFKALYDTPTSTSPVGSPGQSQNPLHTYTWQSPTTLPTGAASEYGTHKPDVDFARPGSTPSYSAAAPETASQSVFGSRSAAAQTPMPQRGPAHAQSVILPFPKRPGDL